MKRDKAITFASNNRYRKLLNNNNTKMPKKHRKKADKHRKKETTKALVQTELKTVLPFISHIPSFSISIPSIHFSTYIFIHKISLQRHEKNGFKRGKRCFLKNEWSNIVIKSRTNVYILLKTASISDGVNQIMPRELS